jgi:serine/threonine protein kinase
MKVIRLGRIGTEEFDINKKSMDSEFDVGFKLGKLNNHLVQITSFFMEGEYCCLIMEYCSCGDLQKIFEKRESIPESVLFLFFYFFI